MLKNKNEFKKVIVAGLVMVIILSGAFSYREYYLISRRSNLIASYYNTISSYQNKIDSIISKSRKPLSAKNIDLVDTWMTFSYINTIFKLQPDYLKNTLNISDIRYPNLSLNGYIRRQKLDKATFLADVKRAVLDYLTK